MSPVNVLPSLHTAAIVLALAADAGITAVAGVVGMFTSVWAKLKFAMVTANARIRVFVCNERSVSVCGPGGIERQKFLISFFASP